MWTPRGAVARFAGDSMDDVMTGSILGLGWQTQDPRYRPLVP